MAGRVGSWAPRACAGTLAVAAVSAGALANAATGDVVFQGCLSGNSSTACGIIAAGVTNGTNSGLDRVSGIAASPDGKSVYLVSGDESAVGVGDDAVSAFRRSRNGGALAYLGCITGEEQSGPDGSGACEATENASSGGLGSGLDRLTDVAVSPDGASVYATSSDDHAIAWFKRNPRNGKLAYKDCLSGHTARIACTLVDTATADGSGGGLGAPRSVVVSPDGKSVYVASGGDDAVTTFKRSARSGKLTFRGCISGDDRSGPAGTDNCELTGSAETFGTDSGLDSPEGLAVSPDGRSVYATSLFDDSVSSFRRDTDTGELTYRGCLTGETESGPSGTAACAEIDAAASFGIASGLDYEVAVSAAPDGKSVYAASLNDDAISTFDRRRSGALAYAGCITGATESGPTESGACAQIDTASATGSRSGLDSPEALEAAADGRSVYAAASDDDAIVTFRRNRASGALTYKRCLTGDGDVGNAVCDEIDVVTPGGGASGLDKPVGLALAPDGTSLYAASAFDDAVVELSRSP